MFEQSKRVLYLYPRSSVPTIPREFFRQGYYELTPVQQLAPMVRALVSCCFDCVVIESDFEEAEQAIEIVNVLDPDVPIIVAANGTSRYHERRIRQQPIYYYHVKGLGLHELRLAIEVARRRKKGHPALRSHAFWPTSREKLSHDSLPCACLADHAPDWFEP